jgi:LysM repeat protein
MNRRQKAGLIAINALISLLIALGVVWVAGQTGWLVGAGQPTPFVIVPPTPTQRPSDTPTLPATATPTVVAAGYLVQPGDTLLGIALRLEVDPQLLLDMNDLDNADRLLVGQELLVPAISLPATTPEPTATLPATATPMATTSATSTATLAATFPISSTATPTATLTITVAVLPPSSGAQLLILGVTTPGRLETEAVVLANQGDEPRQLLNWSLERPDGSRYRFPRFVLRPGAIVRIHTRLGVDDSENLYWSQDQAAWDQAAVVLLTDQAGVEVNRYELP